ncbi:MAG: condensation domain-containing protein [Clostridiales bacterium]|jgi:NRPS condensation-like uncharacterized protein|nr:condensation domain-containing protein [Clostridiales bacterium]
MSSKKIKAQLWDNMQFYFKAYNDATMRSAFFLDGVINVEVFKKALQAVVEKFPIANSRFVRNPIKSYWRMNTDFSAENFFEVFETTSVNHRSRVEKFIVQQIDPTNQLPLKTAIFRKTENGKTVDCLVFLFSHMVADGSGFSLFIKAMADTYNGMLKNPDYACKYNMGDRDYKQFYKYMSEEDRLKAKKMTNYRFEKNERPTLPVKKYEASNERRIITRRIDGFHLIRKYCKRHGFTFNDVILAAYLTTLKKHVALAPDEFLAVDCVLNLRRYMPSDAEVNFCNLVSKVKVNVGNELGADFFDTCKIVHEYMEKSKNELGGLGGLTLLNLMDRIFPFEIGKILIKIFYQNPLIGLSNIGKLDKKHVTFGDLNIEDLIMTGTVKYAPYMLLSLITYEDSIFFCIAEACADEDFKIFEELLNDIADLLETIKSAAFVTPQEKVGVN